MDPCDTKPNLKRERESDDDDGGGDDTNSSSPLAKRQRPNSPKNQPMKITDLNETCLGKILHHLDLMSLFNVAVANECLRVAARKIHQQRFDQKQTFISGHKYYTHTIVEHYNSIDVHGLRPCLQYLRCFGPSIRDLWILYGKWTKQQCEYIHQYINEYCADTLTSISFQDKSCDPIKQFAKPFVNIQEVCAFDVDLGNQLSSFPSWFPNVGTLKLHSIRINKWCIDVPFVHLKHLHLDITAQSDGNGLSVNQAARLVSSNSQLNGLHLYVYGQQRLTAFTLLNMINNNRAITTLTVTMYMSTTIVSASHIERIVREHPSLVELSLRGFTFTAKSAESLIDRLSALTCFCFEIKNTENYDLFALKLNHRWVSSRNGNSINLSLRQN